MTPKAQVTKEKTDKLDFMKTQKFLHQKTLYQQSKKTLRVGKVHAGAHRAY